MEQYKSDMIYAYKYNSVMYIVSQQSNILLTHIAANRTLFVQHMHMHATNS